MVISSSIYCSLQNDKERRCLHSRPAAVAGEMGIFLSWPPATEREEGTYAAFSLEPVIVADVRYTLVILLLSTTTIHFTTTEREKQLLCRDLHFLRPSNQALLAIKATEQNTYKVCRYQNYSTNCVHLRGRCKYITYWSETKVTKDTRVGEGVQKTRRPVSSLRVGI